MAAPNVFNVAVDYWMAKAIARLLDFGVDYHSRFTDLCYADDVVLLSLLVDALADALAILEEEASPLGLTVNWLKTKIQSLSDFLQPLP